MAFETKSSTVSRCMCQSLFTIMKDNNEANKFMVPNNINFERESKFLELI